ncbi:MULTISPECIES: hypothetical protein [Clostridium]|uniref:hypothetical protein n=1 Tax=Clostridium TaxID=1485 RepID=UPI0008215382|nr:hypothetical protein [Clostridium saudiense]MDU7454104.1 hypothetical protein [Clostridium saudiense]MEE0728210.1 hypothetical protein [Clostridium saudiense]SCJ97700.1 Uncharacterised protein [uncultured Clostridium sp.]
MRENIKLVEELIKLLFSLIILLVMIIYLVGSIKEIFTGNNALSFIPNELMMIINILGNIAVIINITRLLIGMVKKEFNKILS